MASERAKEVAERQKAEAKALKEAKKNSTDPKDWGTIRQLRETIKMVVQITPAAKWWLLGAVIGPLLIGVVVGLITGRWIYMPIFGLLVGLTAAMLLLTRLAKTSMYKKFAGQPGAAQVALGLLNKKKWTITPAITATRQQDCVHRVIGPAGIVLVGDGDEQRVKALLTTERKRHEQLGYDVPVSIVSVGDGENQVKLNKACDVIKKLPKKLSSEQVGQLESRLKALDNIRGRVPLPRGPLPNMKGARKAMRGR